MNLVYNPVGAFLPPKQAGIEAQFRKELATRHGVSFTHLYTITNMPISRFLEFLRESGNYEGYMERLAAAFNPSAAAGVMCRYTLSVGWDGTLYDCDFNQMLELPVSQGTPRPHPRLRSGTINAPPDRDWKPLLWLHGRVRLVLRWGRDLNSVKRPPPHISPPHVLQDLALSRPERPASLAAVGVRPTSRQRCRREY